MCVDESFEEYSAHHLLLLLVLFVEGKETATELLEPPKPERELNCVAEDAELLEL